MERDLTDAALDAIAFVTGATLSAMLGLMQWRVDRATGRISGYLLLWVLGFIWTFGNFLRCTLELAGASPDSAGARFAESFAWSCTLLGPHRHRTTAAGGIGTTSRDVEGILRVHDRRVVAESRADDSREPRLRLSARGQRVSDDLVLHRAGRRRHRVCHLSTGTEDANPSAKDDAALVRAGRLAVRGRHTPPPSCSACTSPTCRRPC